MILLTLSTPLRGKQGRYHGPHFTDKDAVQGLLFLPCETRGFIEMILLVFSSLTP